MSVASGFKLSSKERVPYITRHPLHFTNAKEGQTRQAKWRNKGDSVDNVAVWGDFSEFFGQDLQD